MYYRFKKNGGVLFSEKKYMNQLGNLNFDESEMKFFNRQDYCLPCYKKEKNTWKCLDPNKALEIEETITNMDVVCDQSELQWLISKYGKECVSCHEDFFEVSEVDPHNTSPVKTKFY